MEFLTIRMTFTHPGIFVSINFPRKILLYTETTDHSNLPERNGKLSYRSYLTNCVFQSFNRENQNDLAEFELEFLQSTSSLQELITSSDIENYEFIITDKKSLNLFIETGHFFNNKNRYRILDYWGTAPELNHYNLDLRQYLVPFDNPWNFCIGFPIDPNESKKYETNTDITSTRLTSSRLNNGIFYTTASRQFLDLGKDFFDTLATKSPGNIYFHCTLNEEEFLLAKPLFEKFQPGQIINHINITNYKLRKLFAQSSFLIGFGDPILEPTPIEAVFEGCVFLNPVFDSKRRIPKNPRHLITTQHPHLESLGEPWVRSYSLVSNRKTAAENLCDVIEETQRYGSIEKANWHAHKLESSQTRLLINLELDINLDNDTAVNKATYTRINLMLPTRQRVKNEKLPTYLNSALNTMSSNDNVVFTFLIDEDDDQSNIYLTDFCKNYGLDKTQIIVNSSKTPHLGHFYNRLYDETKFQDEKTLVSMTGDDMEFITPNWDQEILASANRSKGLGIIYCNDNFVQRRRLCVNLFVTRTLVELTGKPFVCPWFAGDYLDDVWMAVGEAIGRLIYRGDIIIQHNHVDNDSPDIEVDQTYKRLRQEVSVTRHFSNKINMYAGRIYANLLKAGIND